MDSLTKSEYAYKELYLNRILMSLKYHADRKQRSKYIAQNTYRIDFCILKGNYVSKLFITCISIYQIEQTR